MFLSGSLVNGTGEQGVLATVCRHCLGGCQMHNAKRAQTKLDKTLTNTAKSCWKKILPTVGIPYGYVASEITR